jgi:hypothetical protein
LARQSAHGANKLFDLASPGNRLGAISAMFKGVPVTSPPSIARRASGIDRSALLPVGTAARSSGSGRRISG